MQVRETEKSSLRVNYGFLYLVFFLLNIEKEIAKNIYVDYLCVCHRLLVCFLNVADDTATGSLLFVVELSLILKSLLILKNL